MSRQKGRRDIKGKVLYIHHDSESGNDEIRLQTNLGGTCPMCGGTGTLWPDPEEPKVTHLTYIHEDWCEATLG